MILLHFINFQLYPSIYIILLFLEICSRGKNDESINQSINQSMKKMTITHVDKEWVFFWQKRTHNCFAIINHYLLLDYVYEMANRTTQTTANGYNYQDESGWRTRNWRLICVSNPWQVFFSFLFFLLYWLMSTVRIRLHVQGSRLRTRTITARLEGMRLEMVVFLFFSFFLLYWWFLNRLNYRPRQHTNHEKGPKGHATPFGMFYICFFYFIFPFIF